MQILTCSCGSDETHHEQIQLFNVIICDACEKEAWHMDYDTAVVGWNKLNTPLVKRGITAQFTKII